MYVGLFLQELGFPSQLGSSLSQVIPMMWTRVLPTFIGAFSAGTGLSFSGGQFSFTGDTDDVDEGSSNLYYTDARSRAALSAGTGITYNSELGLVFRVPPLL
jgi:hypothetical protein